MKNRGKPKSVSVFLNATFTLVKIETRQSRMNRYHDENMEWFRNLKPVRNDHEDTKVKRNIFADNLNNL